MAVVLAFRLAVLLASEGATRVLRSQNPLKWRDRLPPGSFEHRFHNSNESDETLSLAASAEFDTLAEVATYTPPFELRKLHMVFSFAGGSPRGDDSRIVTFHFLKLSGGSPAADWSDADFLAVENPLNTCFDLLKPSFMPHTTLDEYRWYKSGPDINPPQEPVRVIDKNVVGTATITAMPPQVATSVTERTASRKAWGRTYWPAPCSNNTGIAAQGRWTSAAMTVWINALDTFYEACRTANVPVVVYSPAKPERSPTASDPRYRTKGVTLAAIGARALTVDTIQIDDVPDVIRSRRHDAPLTKILRGIGS